MKSFIPSRNARQRVGKPPQRHKGGTEQLTRQEIALLASSSIAHYHLGPTGDIELAPEAPPEAMRAIASFKKRCVVTQDGRAHWEAEIRLWDKPAALRLQAQIQQLIQPPQLADATRPVTIQILHFGDPGRNGTRDGQALQVTPGGEDSPAVPLPTATVSDPVIRRWGEGN